MSGETQAAQTEDGQEPDDHEVAYWLAQQAGEQLQALRDELDEANAGYIQRELMGDQLSHRFLTGALAQIRPDDIVLSEEGRDDAARLNENRVWIVDPLDGSSDFADGWSDTWAVHVGLSVDGRPAAGAVSVPTWSRTFGTGNAGSNQPVDSAASFSTKSRRRPLVVISRSRVRWDGHRLARHMDADVYGVGSAGVKAMAVVSGQADAWVHGGGLYEWDTCAPAAVALAWGLHASHLDGSPLLYNQPDSAQWGILICRPELAAEIQAAFA